MANARPAPLNCAACESPTLTAHCKAKGCHWAVCRKCDAVTGVVAEFKSGKFVRYLRRAFGGKPRPVGDTA